MRILLTGGGSGGHIFPLVSIARGLKKIAEKERIYDLEIIYFGPDGFARKLFEDELVKIKILRTGKVRRYWSLLNIFDPLLTLQAIIFAVWELLWLYPDVIFSKGGYGSFPVVLASRIFRIPLIIHESDAVPGKVNNFAKKFASRIAISFPESAKYFPGGKIASTGNPVRREIFGGDKELAISIFSLGGIKPVVLILGGSLGAQKINETVILMINKLAKIAEIIHQTGEKNFKDVKGEGMVELMNSPQEEKDRWHPVSFLNELELRAAYLVADVIISRAGSGGIFEIAASGKPSILIPLSNSAQNHQRENAYAYARSGACVVMEEDNLTPNLLYQEIEKLLTQPEETQELINAAKKFAKPDAAEIIAQEIIDLAATHK